MKTATTKTLRLIGFAVAAFAVIGLSLLNARWATSAQAAGATVTVTIPAPEIFWVDPDIIGLGEEADISIVGWGLLHPTDAAAMPVVWADVGLPNKVELEVYDAYVDEYGDEVAEVYVDGSEFTAGGPVTLSIYSAADIDMVAPAYATIYVIDWDNINTLYLDVWQDEDIAQGQIGELGATVYYWGEAAPTAAAIVEFFDVNPEVITDATPFATTQVTVDSFGQEDTDLVTYTFPNTNSIIIYAKVTGPAGLDQFPFDDYAQVKIELQAQPVTGVPEVNDYTFGPPVGAGTDPNGTTSPTVTVILTGTDPDGFPIYQYLVAVKRFDSASRKWSVVGNPKWYDANDNMVEVYLGNPGTTTVKGGAYYLVPFVGDVKGNAQPLTDTANFKYVNLYALETMNPNATRVFRFWANMGQTINFNVTTAIGGDVDTYLYTDNAGTVMQVFSDTTTANGASIATSAPITGMYQIEVVNSKDDTGPMTPAEIIGYTQINVSGAATKADGKAITAPSAKVLRTAPIAPPGEQPSLRTTVPQSGQAALTTIFLPVIRR